MLLNNEHAFPRRLNKQAMKNDEHIEEHLHHNLKQLLEKREKFHGIFLLGTNKQTNTILILVG